MVKLLGTSSLKFGIFGELFIVILFLLVVSGLLIAIQWLLSKFWCSSHPSTSYEAFEVNTNEIEKRTNALHTLRDRITADLEALDDAADASCDITKQIEDSYVSNNSAPTDPDEYQLPQDIQDSRQQKRNDRTKRRFEDEKKRYSVLKNVAPILECFEDASDAEDELRAQIADIQRILETAEAKAAAAKGLSIESLLGFNAGYLKKGASTVTEGFADKLTGAALLAAADDLIAKGNSLHDDIVKITAEVKTQQAVAKGVFQKTKDLQNGKVSESDAAAAAAKVTSSPS